MLRKTLAALAISFSFAAVVQAAPVAYTIDSAHTDTLFSWNHFGFSNPSANFNNIKGTINFDSAAPANSSVDVTIAVGSVISYVAKLDDELKGDKFLDAGKFPNITFKSTKVEGAAGQNHFKVSGDLTVHGVTKPVVLDATLNKAGEHPMSKAQTVGFNATTTIKRADFGVGAYVPNVSDEIKINITTEASVPKA
ncbi:polyisoprenoid-binding protein [Pseudolysobacter antarcticus]|uniref:Polyisoprenoid-binding protein n=1 Tax=Pseudolysobacter antarcticus TaxID=2511995 RepID=A0A411HNN1_9GAMM|nr:YceI family protein [Pseudolysobacter antarcticus]QBB72072.1 polyisoprenoid-binding protein [Pseudolysobacter antarcticus]